MSATATEPKSSPLATLHHFDAIPTDRRRAYDTLRYLWENGWLSVRYERQVEDDRTVSVIFYGRLRDHEAVICWIEVPASNGGPWRIWSGSGRAMMLGEHASLEALVGAEVAASVDLYDDLANGRVPME